MLHRVDHNSIHASDVLHGVFFMTTAKIPGFCPLNSKLSNDSGSDSDSGLNGEGRQKTDSGDYGVLMDSIPLLELLSLYTAATMHDYDHPGRTNAFLVATLSQQVSLFSFIRRALGKAENSVSYLEHTRVDENGLELGLFRVWRLTSFHT